jgi:recombination protein RecT
MTENLPQERPQTPVARLKKIISMPSIQDQFNNALKENSALFTASLIDLYSGDKGLQQCEPAAVIMEALKAATLKLPINKSLGFAWIIARWNSKDKKMVPAFQIGWKGVVQLAHRTMQYRSINCGKVFEGEFRGMDKLSGDIDLSGTKASDNAVGFFAYFKLLSGFEKTAYWTKHEVIDHAVKYSQESKKAGKLMGNWAEHFESRAMSTVLKHLLSKYGVLSIEMASAFSGESEEDVDFQGEIDSNANQGKLIDITPPSDSSAAADPAPTNSTTPATTTPTETSAPGEHTKAPF